VRYTGPERSTFHGSEFSTGWFGWRAERILGALTTRRFALAAADFKTYLSLFTDEARAKVEADLRPVIEGKKGVARYSLLEHPRRQANR
jgi:hypothetical protein